MLICLLLKDHDAHSRMMPLYDTLRLQSFRHSHCSFNFPIAVFYRSQLHHRIVTSLTSFTVTIDRLISRFASIFTSRSNSYIILHLGPYYLKCHTWFNLLYFKNMSDQNWKTKPPYQKPDQSFNKVLQGACHCGQVKYWLSKDGPLASKYCHCNDCKVIHGILLFLTNFPYQLLLPCL